MRRDGGFRAAAARLTNHRWTPRFGSSARRSEMTAHGQTRSAGEFDISVYYKRDIASLIIVRDVLYRPRWNLEVEKVREADLAALPEDMPPKVRSWIEELRPLL
jgi:hypothetical protein